MYNFSSNEWKKYKAQLLANAKAKINARTINWSAVARQEKLNAIPNINWESIVNSNRKQAEYNREIKRIESILRNAKNINNAFNKLGIKKPTKQCLKFYRFAAHPNRAPNKKNNLNIEKRSLLTKWLSQFNESNRSSGSTNNNSPRRA